MDNMFRNSPLQTKTESERAFQLGFVASRGISKAFYLRDLRRGGLHHHAGFRQHDGDVGASRTREVAVLKTLGFTRQRVLSIFVSESVALAVAGGVLGVLKRFPSLLS